MFPISSAPLEELYTMLQSSVQGLTQAKAILKQQQDKKRGLTLFKRFKTVKLFLSQFKSPLVLLLLAAVILSWVLGETTDAAIILTIIMLSGLLGFFQELHAGRAAEKLKQLLQPKCSILRDGKILDTSISEIVSGDVLMLNAGDIIPADCRIIESNQLQVNESTLTGESLPVEKIPGITDENAALASKTNCAWKGTSVVSGTGKAIAVNTGADTLWGDIEKSLEKEEETAFEKNLKSFGYFLLEITLVLSIVILGINLYFKKPLLESILFSLAISVGMAPELLPAIMTLAMTAGAKRMLNKKVIVKKLSSIFNFGEVNILCTDKTGTITEGTVKLHSICDSQGKPDDSLLLYAVLNAKLQNSFDNPIDTAISQQSIDVSGYTKLGELPYDFTRKKLSVLVEKSGKRWIVTKGAFTNILDSCDSFTKDQAPTPLQNESRKSLTDIYTDLGMQGFRVLGLAYKETTLETLSENDETGMQFLGFILLEDPLKEDVKESIETLKKLHTEVKIITGDNRHVAMYTAKNIGIEEPNILTGDQIKSMSFLNLIQRVKKVDVFAEIEPHQKESIVQALQKGGKTVAYMGDGINDVAAIHAADAGISVNDATDVAKEAADFVLMEKNLTVLADGIYEGRKSFANSLKYILINTGATFGNMFSVAGASLLLPFLPMLPKQILLTNFITDFPYLAVSSDNVDKEQLAKPGKWKLSVIRSFMLVFGLHSSLFDFLTFFVMYFYFKLPQSSFQTGWFLESALSELLILFIIRTRKSFIKSKPGKLLLIISAVAFVITILLPVSPFASMLGLQIAHFEQVIALVLILLLYVVTADLLKVAFFRRMKHKL